MVAAGATKEAKQAKKEAEELAKPPPMTAEEMEKYREKVEVMFEQLLQRISLMDQIADRTEIMCDKMEACEENLQKLESKEWGTFVEMGIVGEGEGDPGTMYDDYMKKCREADGAKSSKGRPTTGYRPHHVHRLKQFAPPAKKEYTTVYDAETESCKLVTWEEYLIISKAKKVEYTTIYDAATQSCKLVTWEEYLKTYKAKKMEYTTVYDTKTQSCKLVTWEEYLRTNKAPPCSNYVTVYNPYTEEVDLLFWSQYICLGLYAEDVAARKKS
jgi:hypothetical protein